MKILDRTFSTPEENLACDEALLEAAEERFSEEVLRFWASEKPFVVLGYSNKIAEEVNFATCQKDLIPLLRRASGGGTVLQGPGCLNYSLILKIKNHPGLANIRSTNQWVMEKNCQALQTLAGPHVSVRGITDLALGNLKFSGNAQRRKRENVLFHGTFLLDFNLGLIEKYLALPLKQPDYRNHRKHEEFLVNLNIKPEEVKKSLIEIWKASGDFDFTYSDKLEKLVESHYSQKVWNFKF